MPKRTNDYQQLVKLIQRAFAPAGALIKESIEHKTADGPREVDVQLETSIGLYKIRIAIEAKAESRPLDVTTIEQFLSKYRCADGIRVDKVVIVSKSGFTEAAKNKAIRNNIEVFTVREAERVDWSRFIPPNARYMVSLRIAPHIREIKLDPPIDASWQEVASEGRVLCRCHGNDFGSVLENAETMFKHHVLSDPAVGKQTDAGIAKGGMVHATFWHPLNYVVFFRGVRHSVTQIWISGSWGHAKAPLRISNWEQTDGTGAKRVLQHAVAEVLGKKIQMVFPNGIESERVPVEIRNLPRKKSAC